MEFVQRDATVKNTDKLAGKSKDVAVKGRTVLLQNFIKQPKVQKDLK